MKRLRKYHRNSPISKVMQTFLHEIIARHHLVKATYSLIHLPLPIIAQMCAQVPPSPRTYVRLSRTYGACVMTVIGAWYSSITPDDLQWLQKISTHSLILKNKFKGEILRKSLMTQVAFRELDIFVLLSLSLSLSLSKSIALNFCGLTLYVVRFTWRFLYRNNVPWKK